MTRTRIHTTSLSPVAARWLALTGTAMAATLLAGALSAVQAQGVYRIVGPDGKVTFSDRAPAAAAQPALRGGAASAVAPAGGQEASLSALPYDLRQTALRFPVTLYTSAECAPCASARSLLQARGVPFSERTVQSNEDIEALQRLSSSASLPFATIGSQQLSGFSDIEWKQYLDAAGYPKQSQLPPGYQRPVATPLVAVKRAEPVRPPSASREKAADATDTVQPARTPSPSPTQANPAGIRF